MFDEIDLRRGRFVGAAAMTIAAAHFDTLAHRSILSPIAFTPATSGS